MGPMCRTCQGAWPPRKPETRWCALIREAIQLYVEALEEDSLPVPEPHSYELVEV